MPHQIGILLRIGVDLRQLGVQVDFEPDWSRRGSPTFAPDATLCHHTAGYGSLRVVRDGRAGLPGPLSQFFLGRDRLVIVAAGRANHAGTGRHTSNTKSWGIEGESLGTRDDWTAFQRRAWPLLNAALCRHTPHSPNRVWEHKEHAPARKIDRVAYDGPSYRYLVAQMLRGGAPQPEPPKPRRQQEMFMFWHEGAVYLVTAKGRSPWGLPGEHVNVLESSGVPVLGRPNDISGYATIPAWA